MSDPATANLKVYQGQDWTQKLQFWADDAQTVPFDLSGYNIDMHVRAKPAAALTDTVLCALTTRLDNSEGAGRIIFEVDSDDVSDPTQGIIYLTLTAAETSAIPWLGRARELPALVTYFYDLELVASDNTVVRVIRGEFVLDAEITVRTA